MRTVGTLTAYFVAGLLLTAASLFALSKLQNPAQHPSQAVPIATDTVATLEPQETTSSSTDDLPELSPDRVESEVQAMRARNEAAMKAGVELLRRGANVGEWKAFCSAHDLYLRAADIDPAADVYRIALATRELPLEIADGRPDLAIDPQIVGEAGYMLFARRSGRLGTVYKPYLSPTVSMDRFLNEND